MVSRSDKTDFKICLNYFKLFFPQIDVGFIYDEPGK